MEEHTYHRYIADIRVREMIDADVRRLRNEAIETWIVTPLKNALRRLLQRLRPAPGSPKSPALVLSRDTAVATTIDARQTVRIDDAAGFDIEVGAGSLWITLENDSKDYVVGPRDVFHVRRNGMTLMHATNAASVRIAYRAAVEASVPQAAPAGASQTTPALQLLARRPGHGADLGVAPTYREPASAAA